MHRSLWLDGGRGRRPIGVTCVVGLAIACSGCATVLSGTVQTIEVASDPAGAECILERESETLGKVTTPGAVRIHRSAHPIRVTCTKDGYHESQVFMGIQPDRSSSFPGLLGARIGAVGTLVDQGSGAASQYAPSVMLWLAPLPQK